MTTIYLVRHAEAEGNLYRIAQGHYNGIITPRGYQQLAALKKRFESVQIDAVYSSDLFRARTTARAIYEPKGLEVRLDEQLREVNMGSWEGRTWQELTMEDPQQMYNFNRDLSQWEIEGGESVAHARDRMIAALKRIAKANEGKTVAVVSHGAVLRITLGTLQGLSLQELGQTPHGDNTAVSCLEWDGETLRVVYRDDNSHLVEAGASTFAKQKWWKSEKMFDNGQYYRPMSEEAATALAALGVRVPQEGECLAVYMDGKVIGLVQLLTEQTADGIGWVGQYWICPEYRGRGLGIPPLGQAVRYYREKGCDRLRLRCEDPQYRGFWEKYGFYAVDEDILEQYIGYEDKAL
ncbi:MAG: GNAT family N-acetyltransferase [Oscillospiraceae bacterium]|nr:GNAT family N-acetyltransferase [Oscillospiraceae bacterium]